MLMPNYISPIYSGLILMSKNYKKHYNIMQVVNVVMVKVAIKALRKKYDPPKNNNCANFNSCGNTCTVIFTCAAFFCCIWRHHSLRCLGVGWLNDANQPF